jgi:8-oxo-dGTP pyrophosphatase MutT (NUDIX family)
VDGLWEEEVMAGKESLVIVHRDDRVLLGLKLRGFGKDKWNGFGGKLEPEDGDSLERCAYREGRQECGIDLKDLVKIGETKYIFDGDEPEHLVTSFKTDYFEGYPVKTKEMRPKWFGVSRIPYDANEWSGGFGMWENDRYWMRHLLREEKFEATIRLRENGETISCVINGRECLV